VRWDRPGHGLLEASSFIELAGHSDLIIEIDRQVLDIVSKQLVEWSSHPLLGKIPISVNVSGRNLSSEGFVDGIIERIEKRGLDPTRLTLELKENTLFENLGLHAPRLQRLRDAGIKIAVDNFGTGYTSLAQMRDLPIDILKIDSSFVRTVTRSSTDRDLIKMIMATGQILGATILAEGVETVEQAEQMIALGTDEMQGYLFSRSLPAEELLDALGIDA
jgi:EAL domain-containing protein (putative c-di-GMP-specific phosphodiesterase class I)